MLGTKLYLHTGRNIDVLEGDKSFVLIALLVSHIVINKNGRGRYSIAPPPGTKPTWRDTGAMASEHLSLH